jgi:hypothetical protein
MIAKARIAPVERWCQRMQEKVSVMPFLALAAGLEIEILTETAFQAENRKGEMEWHWDTTEESYQRMCERVGKPVTARTTRVCASMLEMD